MCIEKKVVTNIEDLYKECMGHDVYIYGAKTIAQRTSLFLEDKGVKVNSFVVSNRYKNPEVLCNKPVLKIEEENLLYECMVLAVDGSIIWRVEEEIEKYNIHKLVIIHPLLVEDFPSNISLSKKSSISQRAILSSDIQVFADETSTIIIEDNVVIKEGTVILASENSRVHIGNGTYIGEKASIIAVDSSEIEISDNSSLDEKCNIYVRENSKIYAKKNFGLGFRSSLCVTKNSIIKYEDNVYLGMILQFVVDRDSRVELKGENYISQNTFIRAVRGAVLSIGKKSTFNLDLHIGVERSCIEIGEDVMCSYFVKMNTGSHKVIDKKTGSDITNRREIKIGNHVWIGMGATLLPGSEIGDNSIVGAAAVVTKKIDSFCSCAGNPAVVRKQEIDWDRDLPIE